MVTLILGKKININNNYEQNFLLKDQERKLKIYVLNDMRHKKKRKQKQNYVQNLV